MAGTLLVRCRIDHRARPAFGRGVPDPARRAEGRGLRVAYVGIATGDTIHGRLRKHCSGKGNWALGRLGDPSSFRFVFYVCDAESAKQIEAHTVTWAKPPFNVRPEYRNLIPSIAVH